MQYLAWIFAVAAGLALTTSVVAETAVVFDASALTWEERCTAEALQGLVNRDGPRLYLEHGHGWDAKWLGIYAERNGMEYERVRGLRELLERFRGSAKGLVVYDPAVDGSRYAAISLAGVEDLIPVCEGVLTGTSPGMLVGGEWPGADFSNADAGFLANWRRAAGPKLELRPGEGLLMEEGNETPGHDWSFISYGPISVDLAKHPLLEVDVAAVEGEGAGWLIKLTWDRDGDGHVAGGQDDLCLPLQHEGGVQRWDIARLGGLEGEHTFALIQLHVFGPQARVLWRRARFVSPEGAAPPVVSPTPLTDLGLPIRHDLRGRFKDSLAAYEWALQEVMPRCNRRFAHAVNGFVEGIRAGCGPFAGFDWPVMQRAFVFNLTCSAKELRSYGDSRVGGSAEQAKMYERIVAALEPPAQITGYGEPEDVWCKLLSEYGHYSFHAYYNWSFHGRVPVKTTAFRQKVRFTPENTKPEADKFYVCFMTSEGDTMKGPIPFFYGSWFEEERGSAPVNWGINPLMAEQFPAMLEYYYDTATPNDYFFAGCSGAGYCYPDHLPNLDQFAEHTAKACRLADIPHIDVWNARKSEVIARYLEIAQPLGMTLLGGPARLRMFDGIPTVTHELAYWQHEAVGGTNFGIAFVDDEKRAEAVKWLVERIEDIARRHYPPFVILVYADLHHYAHHCRLCHEITQALEMGTVHNGKGDGGQSPFPAQRFKPARLDEAMSAIRAWASERVLVGAESLNERLVWAALEGVPTEMPLTLTNGRGEETQVRVEVKAAGAEFASEVRLGAHETREVADLNLTLTTGEADTAYVTIAAAGKQERREASLTVVPWGKPLAQARSVGVWSAPSLNHRSGEVVEIEDALWGRAWASPAPGEESGHIIFGPYAELPAGRYIVAFRVKLAEGASAQQLRPDDMLATLDIFAGGYEGTSETIAKLDLVRADLGAPGKWQWFILEGDWPGLPSLLETRVWWTGRAGMVFDRIAVFRAP